MCRSSDLAHLTRARGCGTLIALGSATSRPISLVRLHSRRPSPRRPATESTHRKAGNIAESPDLFNGTSHRSTRLRSYPSQPIRQAAASSTRRRPRSANTDRQSPRIHPAATHSPGRHAFTRPPQLPGRPLGLRPRENLGVAKPNNVQMPVRNSPCDGLDVRRTKNPNTDHTLVRTLRLRFRSRFRLRFRLRR